MSSMGILPVNSGPRARCPCHALEDARPDQWDREDTPRRPYTVTAIIPHFLPGVDNLIADGQDDYAYMYDKAAIAPKD